MTDEPDANTPPLRRLIVDPDFDVGFPIDVDAFRRAAQFMLTVRKVQRNSGQSLSGRKWLADETLAASVQARQGSRLLTRLTQPPTVIVPAATQQQLFEAFEEMCRRRQLTMPSELRPPIYRLLGIELVINSQVLKATPKQVVSATVYNGSLESVPEINPEFRDMPGIFRQVVINYPSDPEGFLQGAQQAVSRLAQDERFVDFRETPGIFRQAAIGYPSDPEGFLQGVQQVVSRLAHDERFVEFRDTASIFQRAAINYPSDPEGFLRGVQKAVSRLAHDERFVEFRDTASIFQRAAINYPSDPEGFLRGVQKAVSRLAHDERFAVFRHTPSLFHHTAINYPSDPEGHLLKLLVEGQQSPKDGLLCRFVSPKSPASSGHRRGS